MDISNIISQIDNFEFISFDVFDTLIKRDIYRPADIFYIMESIGKNELGEKMIGLAKKRIDAEIVARKKNNYEISYDDILKILSMEFSQSELQWIRKKEEEMELRYSVANKEIVDVFDICVSKKKKVYIISDFYFGHTLIEKILTKANIKNYSGIYVSSDFKFSKNDGGLYRIFKENECIDSNKWLHIGDNKKSDGKEVEKYGGNSIVIPRTYMKLKYNCFCSECYYNSVVAFQNNRVGFWSNTFSIGYEGFGPLLYSFSIWLFNNLEKEKINNVFFLARDGLVLKQAFDIINRSQIKSHYFYASRRALQVPAINNNDSLDDIVKRIYFPYSFTIETFLRKLGIDDINEINKLCQLSGVKKNTVILRKDISVNLDIKKVYTNSKEIIYKNAETERDGFYKYINQVGLTGKAAIVDIGWFGNMQYNLSQLVKDSNVDLYGYYIGIHPDSKRQNTQKMKGFLFDTSSNIDRFYAEVLANSLFELFFTANHGSTHSYGVFGDENYIKLQSYDDSNQARNSIFDFQKGGLQFVKDYSESSIYKCIDDEIAWKMISKQLLDPYYDDAVLWGNLEFDDDNTNVIAKAEKIGFYFRHPMCFIKDYKNSKWEIGFLKQVLKINLSYVWIVKIQKKIFKRFK